MRLRCTTLAAGFLVAGCSGGAGDPLERPEDIAGWANESSALGVYSNAHEPLGLASGAFTYPDPDCPATADDGSALVVTGGCTDATGRTWAGEATVLRGEGRWDVSFDRFGDDRFGGMARLSGSFTLEEQGEDLHAFDADLERDGGIVSRIRYLGSVAGGYGGETVWNGSGTVTRRGVTINAGSVHAETIDERRDDDVCPGEGLSGTTSMTSAEHTVLVTYDGASDCDDDDAARWSLDGVDQGLVTGITCSAGGPTGTGTGAALLLLLVAGALGGRRARRR
jgi:MYXO-CTERM domain-containing protein